MKGATNLSELRQPDYKRYAELGDKYSGLPCHHELIEMDAANWLKAYRKLQRDAYTIPEWEIARLETILAASGNITDCIATSLRLADLQGSADWFKQACRLAQSSTIDQLEYALYYEQNRERYIILVLALVHYELFNSFEFGDYVVCVEIVQQGKQFYRKYINP